MAVYRIYLVHADGRLEPAESFYRATDEEALTELSPPRRANVRAELWQGGRFIAAAGHARARPQVAPLAAPGQSTVH